jgi:hypothetical protein
MVRSCAPRQRSRSVRRSPWPSARRPGQHKDRQHETSALEEGRSGPEVAETPAPPGERNGRSRPAARSAPHTVRGAALLSCITHTRSARLSRISAIRRSFPDRPLRLQTTNLTPGTSAPTHAIFLRACRRSVSGSIFLEQGDEGEHAARAAGAAYVLKARAALDLAAVVAGLGPCAAEAPAKAPERRGQALVTDTQVERVRNVGWHGDNQAGNGPRQTTRRVLPSLDPAREHSRSRSVRAPFGLGQVPGWPSR